MLSKDDKKWIKEQFGIKDKKESSIDTKVLKSKAPSITKYNNESKLTYLLNDINKTQRATYQLITSERKYLQRSINKSMGTIPGIIQTGIGKATKNLQNGINTILSRLYPKIQKANTSIFKNTSKLDDFGTYKSKENKEEKKQYLTKPVINKKPKNIKSMEIDNKVQSEKLIINNSKASKNYILAKEAIINGGNTNIYNIQEKKRTSIFESLKDILGLGQTKKEKAEAKKHNNFITSILSGISKYSKGISDTINAIKNFETLKLILLSVVALKGVDMLIGLYNKFFGASKNNDTKKDFKNRTGDNFRAMTSALSTEALDKDLNTKGDVTKTKSSEYDLSKFEGLGPTSKRQKLINQAVEDNNISKDYAESWSAYKATRHNISDKVSSYESTADYVKFALPYDCFVKSYLPSKSKGKGGDMLIIKAEKGNFEEDQFTSTAIMVTDVIYKRVPVKMLIPKNTLIAYLGKNYTIVGKTEDFSTISNPDFDKYQSDIQKSDEVVDNYKKLEKTDEFAKKSVADFQDKLHKNARQQVLSDTWAGKVVNFSHDVSNTLRDISKGYENNNTEVSVTQVNTEPENKNNPEVSSTVQEALENTKQTNPKPAQKQEVESNNNLININQAPPAPTINETVNINPDAHAALTELKN